MAGRAVLVTVCSSVLGWLAAAGAVAEPSGLHRVGVPDLGWAVEIDLTGFEIVREGASRGGTGRTLTAFNKGTGVNVSVYVEQEQGLADAAACRDHYWAMDQRSPIQKTAVSLFERAPFSMVEWTVPEFRGQRIDQRNRRALLAQPPYCIDVHLSKVTFREGQEELFDQVLATVAVVEEGSPVEPDSAAGSLKLPDGTALEFEGADTWQASVTPGPQGSASLRFAGQGEREVVVIVTIMPPNLRQLSEDEVIQAVRMTGEAELAGAQQTELEIEALAGEQVRGYLYHLTDRQPENGPDDFREARQAILKAGSRLLTVTVLSHEGDGEGPELALALLKSLRFGEAADSP